ncbi:GNAT family N-acetyltransferase (plasmid) [Klebsiella variicola]|nr:GNAT family N-acetyltransferase [Klebsiella variicola]
MKLIAIWWSTPHDFCQKRIERSWRRWYAFLPRSAVGGGQTVTSRSPLCCLPESIWMLFVDPDAMAAAGKLLIEHALSLTPKLTTNVNEQNEQAVGFYQRTGFNATGRSDGRSGQPYPLNLIHEQQATDKIDVATADP